MDARSFGNRLGDTVGRIITAAPARLLAIPALLLALAAVADPVLHLLGAPALATAIHRPLAIFCHQLPERSLHIGGEPMALCSRCFSIYASLALTMLVVPVRGKLAERLPTVPVWVVLAAAIPMAIDGGTQFLGLRESNNVLRILTGIILCVPVGLFVAVAVNQAAREARSRRGAPSDIPAQTRAS